MGHFQLIDVTPWHGMVGLATCATIKGGYGRLIRHMARQEHRYDKPSNAHQSSTDVLDHTTRTLVGEL